MRYYKKFQTSLLSLELLSTYGLLFRVFSRMFQLLCSFYSRNILYISKMSSTKSLIFELNFTMFSTLFYYTESLMYIRNLWLFTHDF